MFGRKKSPVLTGTTCRKLEQLRMAVEVLVGSHVRLHELDFNTGYGTLIVGKLIVSVDVSLSDRDDLIHFRLGHPDLACDWNIALFDNWIVKVISEHKPRVKNTVAGPFTLRWVGTSWVDRREEPLHLRNFEDCARARGLTPEELLKTEAA
jgi:hypothetical protein